MKGLFAAVVLAALGAGSAWADVVNGGFESGTPNDGAGTHWTRLSPGATGLAGWEVTSGNVDWWSAEVGTPCTGSRSLELNGNTNGTVRQTIATKPGVAYRVTFCLSGNPNPGGQPRVKTIDVSAGDNHASYGFDTIGRTPTDMGWETRTFTFNATADSTPLTFTSTTVRTDGGLNAYGPVIDDVVVVEDRVTRALTDQWWIPEESGWGASVFQQADTLFILFYVYGQDNKPTWFVAVATYQSGPPTGRVVFGGDLYVTTGPWFGAPFESAPVVERKAGTITFDSETSDTATISYTVDGVPVTKHVTRQFWALENLAGRYYGGFVWDQACGPQGEERDHLEFLGSLQVTHVDGTVTIVPQVASFYENGVAQDVPANASVSLAGPYTQSGHLGRVQATMSFVFGDEHGSVAWNLLDIERSINGITGRFEGLPSQDNDCRYDGRFGGVRR